MFKECWNITFSEKQHSIQAQLQILYPRGNPGVQMGWFQRSDVTTASHAHTSDVTFSKYYFRQLVQKIIVYISEFSLQSKEAIRFNSIFA